mgnify:CR=1 FL=1
MTLDTDQITLIERRLELLKITSRLWSKNAPVQDVAKVLLNPKFKDVSTHDDFIRTLQEIHDAAEDADIVIF